MAKEKDNRLDWRRGTASLIICMSITLLIVFLLVLYMTFMNILYANTVATTRADAIADSVAVYAQSYDYEYNRSQAETMTNLLTDYNNNASSFYELETAISFPKDNVLTVKCAVRTPTFYPDMVGSEYVYSYAESTVESVDVWGDVLVVPEDIAQSWRDADGGG